MPQLQGHTPLIRPTLVLVGLLGGALLLAPAELLEGFSLGSGDSVALVLRSQKQIGFAVCALAVLSWFLVAVAVRRMRTLDDEDRRWWCGPQTQLPAWREVALWGAVAAGLVLATDGPSLVWHDFETDDFTLLNADDELPLRELLLRTHNDHTIPLLRLEIRCWRSLFGTHSFAFACAAMGIQMGLLWSTAILLRMHAVSRAAILFGLLLMSGWTLWGQFTSGAFILQKYLQISICGVLSAVCWLSWRRTGRPIYGLALWAGSLWSCGLNISGFWVPCAVLTVAACEWLNPRPAIDRRIGLGWLAGLAALTIGLACAHAWIYSLPGNSALLSSGGARPTLVRLAAHLGVLLSTTLISTIIPTPHHLAKLNLLAPTLIAVGLAAVSALLWAVRSSPRHRPALAACVCIALGIGAMVCVGRPIEVVSTTLPAKYLGPLYVWICCIAALVFDSAMTRSVGSRQIFVLKLGCLFIGCSWVAHGALSAAHWVNMPFFARDVSRVSQWCWHVRTRQAIDDLRLRFAQPVERLDPLRRSLPEVPGERLCRAYPALVYPWGEEPRLSTFRCVLFRRPAAWTFSAGDQPPDPQVVVLIRGDPLLSLLFIP